MNKIMKVLAITFVFFIGFLFEFNTISYKEIDSTVEKKWGPSKKAIGEIFESSYSKEEVDAKVPSTIEKEETESTKNKKIPPSEVTETKAISVSENSNLIEKVILNVPLINQMDNPRLYNGCEVTSLAMMLNYSGIKVTKNELAAKITRVPLKYADGTNGNPNVGFVGNMEDGPGLGVYHKPIFQLAQKYVKNGVVDLTKQPFSAVIEKVAQGKPVWIITTTTFSPTSQIKSWSTPQGPVAVSYKMHSVVITGFDKDSIYINDPYGTKNKKLNKENFIKAWEQMGSQAVVITGA